MSVMIDTSLGEVVIDLFCDEAPLASKNFLKLCKLKYYNGCLFYNVQQNFMIQTGDPTATGKGGTSAYGIMYGEQARFFEDEIKPTSRKHDEVGLVSMANMGVPNSNGSQFFFTMRGDDMQHLDGKHTVFAKVMEGMDTLEEINGQFCDDNGRPYRDIRILHTYILDDPFEDPPQLVEPDSSPVRDRPEEERVPLRLGALDKVSLETDERTELEREKELREKTARSNAVVLEMIGDLPDADMKPPENVLFVCKLNPVTTDDDLEIIFTRFGPCRAEICRDHVTGDSLNYAFVEFEAVESCEEAFKKMNNVLIDDRRIRVDFSQSVAKEWTKYKSRAQGGQKLASGKSVKPAHGKKQEPPLAAPRNNTASGRGGDGGGGRRSKWGNASVPEAHTSTPASGSTGNSRADNVGGDLRHERGSYQDNVGNGARGGKRGHDRGGTRGNGHGVEVERREREGKERLSGGRGEGAGDSDRGGSRGGGRGKDGSGGDRQRSGERGYGDDRRDRDGHRKERGGRAGGEGSGGGRRDRDDRDDRDDDDRRGSGGKRSRREGSGRDHRDNGSANGGRRERHGGGGDDREGGDRRSGKAERDDRRSGERRERGQGGHGERGGRDRKRSRSRSRERTRKRSTSRERRRR